MASKNFFPISQPDLNVQEFNSLDPSIDLVTFGGQRHGQVIWVDYMNT